MRQNESPPRHHMKATRRSSPPARSRALERPPHIRSSSTGIATGAEARDAFHEPIGNVRGWFRDVSIRLITILTTSP